MRWDKYYRGLDRDQREAFAERVGTTTKYIEIHYLAKTRRRKTPRDMEALAGASEGTCSLEDVLAYFYGTRAA